MFIYHEGLVNRRLLAGINLISGNAVIVKAEPFSYAVVLPVTSVLNRVFRDYLERAILTKVIQSNIYPEGGRSRTGRLATKDRYARPWP